MTKKTMRGRKPLGLDQKKDFTLILNFFHFSLYSTTCIKEFYKLSGGNSQLCPIPRSPSTPPPPAMWSLACVTTFTGLKIGQDFNCFIDQGFKVSFSVTNLFGAAVIISTMLPS
jgi:hypothetical protein